MAASPRPITAAARAGPPGSDRRERPVERQAGWPANWPVESPVERSVEWRVTPGLVDYAEAVAAMDARVAAIRSGTAPEQVWLLEHPDVLTAGTSTAPEDLPPSSRTPVVRTGRGGRATYHGPGQRVGYVLLDLQRRGPDVRRYVQSLEQWLVDALAGLGVAAFTAPGRVGVWVRGPSGEAKVGAIGVRVRHWVSFHGFAVNVAPDLSRFEEIVPCGLRGYGVTSLADLGVSAAMGDLDRALARSFPAFLDHLRADQDPN